MLHACSLTEDYPPSVLNETESPRENKKHCGL